MNRILAIIVVTLVFAAGVGAAFFTGVYFGYENRPAVEKVTTLFDKETGQPASVDFSPFWEAWTILDEKYVDTHGTSTKPVTDQEKVWGAIAGLAGAFDDPYTVFLPPEEKKQFEGDIQGSFSGVGMEIGVRDGQLVVISPLPNTPAKLAGVKTGDKIIKIDEQTTAKLNVSEAAQMIRGEQGTVVVLTVLRGDNNEQFEFKITRDKINIPTIETELLPAGVFIIRLFNFSAPAPNLFQEALREFADSGTDKLVIDLRGNPGGFLESAVHVASWFLPSDKVVVTEISGNGRKEKVHNSFGFDVFTGELKLAILVDQGSASASEILAGALRDHGLATLVGQKTFGKGSVQELVPVTDDTSLKITIARWLTPSGHSISEDGLEPDIIVEITPEDIENDRDPQLDRAVEFLLSGK